MPNFTLFRENVVFFHAGGTLAIAGDGRRRTCPD